MRQSLEMLWWDAGTSLSDTAINNCTPEQIASVSFKYRLTKAMQSPNDPRLQKLPNGEPDMEVVLALADGGAMATDAYSKDAEEQVLARLEQGELIALGYQGPRRMGGKPMVIKGLEKADFIDWAHSACELQSVPYVEIRTIPETEAKQIQAENSELVHKTKRGAIGTANMIFAIYEELRDEGLINPVSIRSNASLVQDRLAQKHPDMGFSSLPPVKPSIRTIQKAINEQFFADFPK